MTPAARTLSGIPVVTSFLLASACARTGDIERADAGAQPGPDGGDASTGDIATSDAPTSDAGGVEALAGAIGDYCVALRACDPDQFAQRFGAGTAACARAVIEQLSSYYEQGLFSPACLDAYRAAIGCTVDNGYCSEEYDEYSGEWVMELQPTYECAPVFERLEQDCELYGYDDRYDDGEGRAP